jgi:molybdopterin-containing oxidoreductase family iron-sulfur binding subunit
VIDLDRCTGCQACTIACRTENNVPFCGDANAKKGRAIFWNKVVAFRPDAHEPVEGVAREAKVAPDPGAGGETGAAAAPNGHAAKKRPHLKFLPMPCMHCDNSPCTMLCPVRATFRGADGIVMQVPSRCIGCRLCQAACPYSRRYFNWQEPLYPEDLVQGLNPDVSLRTLGVIEKCTFCVHRLQKAREQARAENREIREGEYTPACVEACPAKARTFGDLNNPEHAVYTLSRSARAFQLLPELGTSPKVFYLKEGSWGVEGLEERLRRKAENV